ncbi:DNA mismatch repair protein MutS, partial [Myxococcota bacterium]|nr:DNA mismatch repair protein MutS [Myxococcota bacterium]
REITDIHSPGTFLDPNAPPRVPTYLVALELASADKKRRKPGSTAWGLAALDLSTGEFRATSGDEDELLMDELGRLGARELCISSERKGDARIERLQSELPKTALTWVHGDRYGAARAKDTVAKKLGADEVKALEPILGDEALVAAGIALGYVEETQAKAVADGKEKREPLRHVQELRPYLPGEALVLDLQARAHLELFRAAGDGGKRGSLIGAIDEAITAMGGRLLGRWLAYPLRESRAIHERQDAVAALVARPTSLDRMREALRAVADLERLVGRVVMQRATPRDLGVLRTTLEQVPVILAEARVASGLDAGGSLRPGDDGFALEADDPSTPRSELLSRLASADACTDVVEYLARALVDEPPVDLEAGDIFRAGFDLELDRLSELAKNGKSMIAAMEADEREKTGISSLKVRYNRVFGYYIEITRSNLKNVPSRYIRKQTTANGERYYTEALRELETEVLSAEDKRTTHTRKLFHELVERVGREVKRLRRLAEALATLDVLGGFARIAEQRSWTRPVVDDGGAIELVDGRHPVLEQLSADLGERFVPNDLVISGDKSLMIITGPNMAGKSTIMRQTALVVILAHMGAFVPAKSARIGLVDRIFTRVGASDDLSRGRSTFMVEMTETARILRSATRHSLILLDEIGRGTSTFDGLSIAWAVAEHLHDHVGAKTLFATHYHELTELCRDKPRSTNHHVEVKEWNDQIVFLRKLLPGPTNKSYGVQVARLAGLPKGVVERAKTVLASLEAQALAAGDASAVERFAPVPRPRMRSKAAQLFLFGGGPGDDEVSEPPAPAMLPVGSAEVIEALESMSLDDLTPRQALERLFELKDLLKKQRKR